MQLNMPRRRFLSNAGLLIVGTAAGSGGLSAFRSVGATAPPGAGDIANASGEFDYWVAMDADQQPNFETYIVDAFGEANPEITMNISYRTFDTINQQIQTALAAGRGPDLISGLGPASVGAYAEADLLL